MVDNDGAAAAAAAPPPSDIAEVLVEYNRGKVCIEVLVDRRIRLDGFLRECARCFGIPDGVALRAHSDNGNKKKMTPEAFGRMMSDPLLLPTISIFYDGRWTENERDILHKGEIVETRTDVQVKTHLQKCKADLLPPKKKKRTKRKQEADRLPPKKKKRTKREVDVEEARAYWRRVVKKPKKCCMPECKKLGKVPEYYNEAECKWLCRYHARIQDGQSAWIMADISTPIMTPTPLPSPSPHPHTWL